MIATRFFLVIIAALTQMNIYVSGQDSQPNVLLIIADDLGIDAIDGFGLDISDPPSTPNIKQLQEDGLSFTNTWATPQCAPTRAAIMSGKYGVKTGVREVPGNLNLEDESIFTRLKRVTDDAYATALIGKWHISNPVNSDHPHQHGVDHFEGLLRGGVNDYYNWEKDINGRTVDVADYITSHYTDAAIDWLSEQDQPWFLWLAHSAPHNPYQLPPSNLFSISNPQSDSELHKAMIEALDTEIGRLLQSLDQEIRDNTYVIFIGDKGTASRVLEFFGRGRGKGSMFEGGLRVPMVITGPRVTRVGEVEPGLAQTTDLYATILELCGEPLEGGVYNSLSLASSLTSDEAITRPYIYSDYLDDGEDFWAIKNLTYKLIENERGVQQFYRIDENVAEENNLINRLSGEEEAIFLDMEAEATVIREAWSCQDGILNGDEEEIDDCGMTTTSTFSLSNTRLDIYPNPTGALIKIISDASLSFNASLYNSTGTLIMSLDNEDVIDITGLHPGLYYLKITDLQKGESIVDEIVIQTR